MSIFFDFVQLRIAKGSFARFADISWDNTEEIIEKIGTDNVFLEALFLASPSFYDTLFCELKNKNLSLPVAKTLYKYYARYATRSTPFGLFAGVSTLKIGIDCRFNILEYCSNIELDFNIKRYLHETNFQGFELDSTFYLNPSIIELDKEFRFLEITSDALKISYIKKEKFICSLVNTKKHYLSYEDLIHVFSNEKIPNSEINEIISELISEQILISTKGFPSKGLTSLELIKILKPNNSLLLKKTKRIFESNSDVFQKSQEIKDVLELGSFASNSSPIYITENIKTINSRVSKAQLDNIVQQIFEVSELIKPRTNEKLEKFKERFETKYGEREVPLSIVLDPEIGINYKGEANNGLSSILNKLNLKTEENREGLGHEDMFYNLIQNANEHSKLIYEFKPKACPCLEEFLSPTYYVHGAIYTPSLEDFDESNFQFYLKSIGGSSAANLMSRFSLNDPDLELKIKEIVDYENGIFDNCIVAEINYTPDSSVANVVCHKTLRDFEISYSSSHTMSIDRQIPIQDIFVSLSQGQVRLRSKMHNKRVIPRLSNAYNYSLGPPLLSFLGDLQFNKESLNFKWNWGKYDKHNFIPRITYKNLILTRARWKLTSENFNKILLELPRYVVELDGDNELVLDLRSKFCQKIILDSIVQKEAIFVEESLSNESNCFISRESIGYVSEVVIPLKNLGYKLHEIKEKSSNNNKSFLPGESWFYMKIYTGENIFENSQLETLIKIVESLIEKGVIEKWFFIRYYDPDFHIRIRFYSAKLDKESIILRAFNNIFKTEIENDIINRIVIDTYHPEYDRYAGFPKFEDVFCKDSFFVIRLLRIINLNSEFDRIFYAVRTVILFLESFKLSFEDIIVFSLDQRDKLLEEQGEKKWNREILNSEYRSIKSDLTNFLSSNNKIKLKIERIFKSVFGNLFSECSTSQKMVLGSFIHLHLNRLFTTDARKYEMIVYHFVFKYTQSYKKRLDNRK